MEDHVQLKEQAMELFRAGHFDEAAQHLDQVYQAHVSAGRLAAAAEALNDRGVCLRQAGRLDEAEKCLMEARNLFKKNGDVRSEAQVLGNLGALCESRHQDAKAINLYRECIALLDQCDEPVLSRDAWMALGRLRLRKHQWLPALAAYDMGLSSEVPLTPTQRALRALVKFTRRLALRS